jgi:hypothetical protein
MTRSDPNYITAQQRRYMKENPLPHYHLLHQSRRICSKPIERDVKRGCLLKIKRQKEPICLIEEEAILETTKLEPGMTSARATAIKYLFINVFHSPPEEKWASMHLVSDIRKR